MAKALIPNTQIEEMFYKIATGRQIATYIHFNDVGLATAYASQIVRDKFFEMVKNQTNSQYEEAIAK